MIPLVAEELGRRFHAEILDERHRVADIAAKFMGQAGASEALIDLMEKAIYPLMRVREEINHAEPHSQGAGETSQASETEDQASS